MSSLAKNTRATVIPCFRYRNAPAAIEDSGGRGFTCAISRATSGTSARTIRGAPGSEQYVALPPIVSVGASG